MGTFASFDEDRFQFLTATVQNKVNAYHDNLLAQCQPLSPKPNLMPTTCEKALESIKKELIKPKARLMSFNSRSSRRARTESEQVEDSFACD